LAKKDGKKIYVSSTIEDGMGTVFTTGEGMFIEIRKTKL
jgi:acyl-coenzyme A thioesterase THEM4